jgi:uncharacterized membrane protein
VSVTEDIPIKPKPRWRDRLRGYFLSGLLVFLPVAITLWVVGWVIDLLDSVLEVLPAAAHPNSYLPVPIPNWCGGHPRPDFPSRYRRAGARRAAFWPPGTMCSAGFRSFAVYTAAKLVQTFLDTVTNRQVVTIEHRARASTPSALPWPGMDELQSKVKRRWINRFIPTTPNPPPVPALSRQ